MSRIAEHRDRSVERNLFAYALLGLLDYSARVRGFIEHHLLSPASEVGAVTGTPPFDSEGTPNELSREGYAILGALSLAGVVESLLTGWLKEGQEPMGVVSVLSAAGPAMNPRDLLR